MGVEVLVVLGGLLTPFDHAAHFAAMEERRCDGCHPGDGSADRARPGSGAGAVAAAAHRTCSEGACHAGAFGPRVAAESMCGVCHVAAGEAGVEWERMRVMAPFPRVARSESEVCVTFSHALHGDDERMEGEAPVAGCASCHRLEGGEASDRPHAEGGPGHRACAGCHVGEGRAFDMGDCARCHPTAPSDGPCRPALREARSTLRGFSHARHASARHPRRGRLGCGDCHAGVARAESVGAIELLGRGKATMNGVCRDCHDGRVAFHIDTACGRCHPRGFVERRATRTFTHVRR